MKYEVSMSRFGSRSLDHMGAQAGRERESGRYLDFKGLRPVMVMPLARPIAQ